MHIFSHCVVYLVLADSSFFMQTMPQVSVFLGIAISMYYNEHNPPHFHAEYNGKEAEILINPVSLRSGVLPGRVLGLVMEWTHLHQQELLENWERARQKQPLLSIPGLDQ